MHISIADDLKKQFHAACALRGLKMSQVVSQLIEQWLKNNENNVSKIKFDRRLTKFNQPK
ncbi:MAG: plasmid partition protein ParG [Nostocales cyanobacterium 94392]|nr:plasmid partition protein ParG [Nostocales cyanobacterium 94392]